MGEYSGCRVGACLQKHWFKRNDILLGKQNWYFTLNSVHTHIQTNITTDDMHLKHNTLLLTIVLTVGYLEWMFLEIKSMIFAWTNISVKKKKKCPFIITIHAIFTAVSTDPIKLISNRSIHTHTHTYIRAPFSEFTTSVWLNALDESKRKKTEKWKVTNDGSHFCPCHQEYNQESITVLICYTVQTTDIITNTH